jgi:S1-C subfamily serine protease
MSELEPPTGTEIDSAQSSEVESVQRGLTSVKVTQALGRVWNNSHLWRVTTLLLIFAVGLQAAYMQPLKDFYTQTDPDTNGYVEPRDLGSIIDKLDASVLTIYCEINEQDSIQGTAWSFDYQDVTNTGNSALMTNHHVIEDCISGGRLTLEDYWGDTYDARLESYDEYNDLAIVSTSHKIPPLTLASYPPSGGYWVMAYGTADGYSGSIATGNIINLDEYGDLLITANLSGGNSGGPLVDNEGNVFGVNTWTYNSERDNTQYNISVSLDSFCDKLLVCDGETYWDWD